jgi:hypothetical protein
MKECKECKRTDVNFYSKKHLKCIKCFNQKTIKVERIPIKRKKNPIIPLIKKKRMECSQFILSKNNDHAYNNDLGCTYKKIRSHIEKQFVNGMSWDSHGGWHIDHIIPLSSANNESQLKKLLRWQNVRPLWAEANLRKKDGKISNEKLIEINKKMEERYYQAMEKLNSGIVKTKTTREMYELLKDFGIVTMNNLIIYARSIGYEREDEDLFIKRRKL